MLSPTNKDNQILQHSGSLTTNHHPVCRFLDITPSLVTGGKLYPEFYGDHFLTFLYNFKLNHTVCFSTSCK